MKLGEHVVVNAFNAASMSSVGAETYEQPRSSLPTMCGLPATGYCCIALSEEGVSARSGIVHQALHAKAYPIPFRNDLRQRIRSVRLSSVAVPDRSAVRRDGPSAAPDLRYDPELCPGRRLTRLRGCNQF